MKKLAPLMDLEQRLIRQLSNPDDDDEPTRVCIRFSCYWMKLTELWLPKASDCRKSTVVADRSSDTIPFTCLQYSYRSIHVACFAQQQGAGTETD